jgi:thiol-disulfide isomerase/thioredoxin
MKSLMSILLLAVMIAGLAPTIQAGVKPAPNFVLKTSDGQTVELKKLVGKVVVINFWATWCGPCRMEIPGMLEVYKKYKGEGLEIIGVSLDQKGWSVVTPYVEKTKIDYPIVLGTEQVVSDYGNLQAIPSTFVVDKKGNIVAEHTGSLSKDAFEQMIKPFL